MKLVYCFILTLLFITGASAQGYLHTDGQKIVNEKDENVLLRGMGLGGWMLQEGYMLGLHDSAQQQVIRRRLERIMSKQQVDEFYDVWLNNFITRGDIDSLKAWGFNSVRLPMHYNLFTLPVDEEPVSGNNTWLAKGFALTDSLLSWCKANEMYLVLDMHAAPGGQGNDLNISDRDPSKPSLWESDANRRKLVTLWKQLATRYADEKWIGAYDIINEPNWGFEDLANDRNGLKEKQNKPLRQLLVDITTAIRSVDKNHMIVIEGNGWGNNYNGILDGGIWDNNLVLSFHKYWNYNDEVSIKHIVDYREKYNIPAWLGESGENSNVWYTEAITLLENHNIGWAWWPLKKLGANNPLQVPTNPNYEKLVAYLNAKSKEVPGESDSYSGLLEMAANTHVRSNIVHHDVTDALMRQPHDHTTRPFKSISIGKRTELSATDYDLGGNGFAYYDNDTADYHTSGKSGEWNRGRTYRNDGVDIFIDSSWYNAYYVGSIEPGEWMQYTIDVKTVGPYDVSVKLASALPVAFEISENGKPLKRQDIDTLKPGWQWISAGKLTLQKGKHVIRLKAVTGGFQLSSIRFKKA